MDEKKNEIILFENQGVKLEVKLKEETVWLTQAQMAELFDVKQSTLSEHISNIFKEGELEETTSIGISDKSSGGRKSKLYNLDVIISVGYRVKSKNGVIFRQWANKILKDYMLKGYAVNQRRLECSEKTIKLIDIANRIDERLENNDAKEILKVIGEYSKALDLLDDYDHRTLKKIDGNTDERKIEYTECIEIINKLRFNEESSLFAIERDKGLESIIGNIYQSFSGQDIYKSIEEKGANIVAFLREISNSDDSANLVKTASASNTLKKSLIGIGVIVGVSTLVLGAYKAYQKFREKKQNVNQEDIISDGFNLSLNNYINAIKDGNLSLDILEEFIWNINFIKKNFQNKEIEITISIQQLEELVNLIYNYTIKLAEVNNIDYTFVKDNKEKNKDDSLSNIIYYLDFQKKIFERENVS